MTESLRAGHYMTNAPDAESKPLTIEALYSAHFNFVWRSLKHLGVLDASIDDAVQDTFVVAHRRLHDFAERSTPRTWLFGIALRVASDHRRASGRRERFLESFGHNPKPPTNTPYDHTVRSQAGRLLREFLDTLPEDQRAVFLLAEIEQMTAPEISETLSVNLNTVYSRLRTARLAFNSAVANIAAADRAHRHG
jgi:RNA polymerase sigma-70 factor (ECF subfamily)